MAMKLVTYTYLLALSTTVLAVIPKPPELANVAVVEGANGPGIAYLCFNGAAAQRRKETLLGLGANSRGKHDHQPNPPNIVKILIFVPRLQISLLPCLKRMLSIVVLRKGLTDDVRGCAMDASQYPYGDVYPDGTPKQGDAANFGPFKNNCTSHDLRLSHAARLLLHPLPLRRRMRKHFCPLQSTLSDTYKRSTCFSTAQFAYPLH